MMAALTARRRKALPSSKFALLGKGTGMGGKGPGRLSGRHAAPRRQRIVARRAARHAGGKSRGPRESRGRIPRH